MMLLDHYLGRVVPIRFIAFSLVGLLGLGVHLLVLATLFRGSARHSSWRRPRRRSLP